MDNYFWVTTRTITPGPREHFEQAWRPAEFPPGWWGPTCSTPTTAMRSWASRSGDSAEACHRYRDSDVEARRPALMDPFVLEERSRFYTGRELGVPGR